MLIILSAFAAIVPMSIYLVLIWKFDQYDREPFKLVLINYLWGALGAIVLALLGSLFFTTIASVFIKDSLQLSRFGAIVVAPIVEEITKGFSSRKSKNIHAVVTCKTAPAATPSAAPMP